MSEDNVIFLPCMQTKAEPTTRSLLFNDIELIGFLTIDDRDIYVKEKADIMKIMSFILREGISLKEMAD